MSITIGLDEAQARLREIIANLRPDDEVFILDNQRPVARLTGETILKRATRKPRKPGNCKGMIQLLVEDDEHLDGFPQGEPS